MEIYNGTLTGRFDEDVAVMDAILRTDSSFDMLRKTMEVAGARIVMYYIDGLMKAAALQKRLTYVLSSERMADRQPGGAE